MSDSFVQSADYYRRFAESMVRDIDSMKSDIKFVKGGGRILTAADFSEIYAYCMSASDSFLSRTNVPEDASQRAVLNELHDSIMLFYLFESDEPLWLLDPYLLELRNFLRTISSNRFKGQVRTFGDALRQIRLAQTDPEFLELKQLANEKLKSGLALKLDELERAFRFIEKVAPALVQFARDKSGKPSDRLRRLLREGHLLIPNDIPDSFQTGDKDVYARWYERLSKLRRDHDAQNASDASAAAILFSLNRWLVKQERPRRIVLLTRSETMHTIMRAEDANALWDDAGGNSLRHPRIVLALLDQNAEIVRSSHPDRQLQVVSRWEQTFAPIANISQKIDGPVGSLTPQEITKRHIALIADVWRRYCSVKATKLAVEHKYLNDSSELSALSVLVDPESLKRSIRERLNKLDSVLSGSHFVFATLISPEFATLSSQDSKDNRISSRPSIFTELNISSSRLQSSTFIQLAGAHGAPMPFRIILSDPRLLNVLRQEAAEPFKAFSVVSQENMLDDPRPDVEDTSDIEAQWYLAMGYICAAIGAWAASQRASEFILRGKNNWHFEAQLLSAKAQRHLSEKTSDLLFVAKALRELLSSLLPLSDSGRSTRVCSEQIKYELIIARRAIDFGDSSLLLSQKSEIERSLPDALHLASIGTPSAERLELINNILYHSMQLLISNQEVISLERIARLFDVFQNEITVVYGIRWEAWPDNFLDTYAWSRLHLIRRSAVKADSKETEEGRILRPLETIAAREYVSTVDISDFRLHAQEAATYFRKGNRIHVI